MAAMGDGKLTEKAQGINPTPGPSPNDDMEEIELSEAPGHPKPDTEDEHVFKPPPTIWGLIHRWFNSFTELEIVLTFLNAIVLVMLLVHFIMRISDPERCYYDMWDMNYVIDHQENVYRPEFDWNRIAQRPS